VVHSLIYGKFTGTLKLSPVGDGIHMTVLEAISYDDGLRHELDVPANFETDGASIPRALWTIVGSPFSGGNYVEAAVIHDEGCVSHKYDWQTTHMMFYRAMIDSGVSEHYAKLLYYGVRLGGPRWEEVATGPPGSFGKTGGSTTLEEVLPPVITSPDLTNKLKEFDSELKKSEAAGHPISIRTIDKRTVGPDNTP
jgi:hypothetical protein